MFTTPGFKAPMLPMVAVKLLELSRNQDFSFEEFGRLLESDPTLTGEVLKIAGSPLYSALVTIKSIRQALLRLGQRTLTDLVMQAAMNGKVFRAPGLDHLLDRLRLHGVVVGHLTRMICSERKLPGDEGFLLGLMHDAGVAVGVLALNSNGYRTDWGAAYGALIEAHQQISEALITYWHLPEDFLIPLTRHHQPDMLLNDVGAALVLADSIADDLGYRIPPGPADAKEPYPTRELAQGLLGISDEETTALTERGRALLREAQLG